MNLMIKEVQKRKNGKVDEVGQQIIGDLENRYLYR